MVNNKLIVKNSIYLYIRMFFVMAVSLFSVRIVLKALGVVDYGIYNVVGGVVTMLSFLSGSMATSSQRYFSIEIARGDNISLKRIFSLNISLFAIFAVLVIVIAETIGLWFVNSKMTIPENRLLATNIVYQMSILSFVVQLFAIPYNALIIAYERMTAFAWIGIIEVMLKLFAAYIIMYIAMDKLILYSLVMFVSCIITTVCYYVYCRIHFNNCKYTFYWNRNEAMSLLAFSGWHFLGTTAVVIRSQGINILINLFFNPAINAARAIAFQVENAVLRFSNNFFTAVKPQIYKSYSTGEMQALYLLIKRSTILSMYLVSLLIFPIIFNVEFILRVWLDDIPQHAILFTQLALLNGLIDASNGPTIAPALATGNIKRFELVTSLIFIANLPIAYILLQMGASPESTVYISIILSVICMFVRAYFLKGMIGFPFGEYVKLILRIVFVSLMLYTLLSNIYIAPGLYRLVLLSGVSVVFTSILYMLLVMSKQDRCFVISFVRSKILK